MPIQLRQANPQDLDALCGLERACFTEDGFGRRQLAYLLTRAHGVAWLIEEDEKHVLGYAILLLRRGSASGRLYSFCLDPAARGRGLAARLLEALRNIAIGRGLNRLTLEVRVDNPAAIRLYRRNGFQCLRRLTNYYADGCDAWYMVLGLMDEKPPSER
ncbi:GNAT family N-acetyltransferase [Pistricoccus aurantiacus]|uniref:GNAT family N-acetyltransferase n=1 Tax=Pistricoccus aurantiacus TaxID=1883414 RepID=UPI00363BE7A0